MIYGELCIWLLLVDFGTYHLFCFRVVEFRTRNDMLRAIKTLHESMLDGRKLFLKEVCTHHMAKLCSFLGHRGTLAASHGSWQEFGKATRQPG